MVVNKSKSAFKTIAEAAEDLGVATHVLRFWETKFTQIKPMKATGGRRYYRPDDVEVLKLIKTLLYQKRYTIENNRLKDIIGGTIQSDFFEEDTGNVPSADELINELSVQDTVKEPEVIEKVVEKRVEVMPEAKLAEIRLARDELLSIKEGLNAIIAQ